MPVHLVIVLAVGALTAALLMAIVVQARHGLRALIIGDAPNRIRRGLAVAAPYLTGLYIVVIWLHWADAILTRQATGIWAAVVVFIFVVSLPAIDRWAKRTLIRVFHVEEIAATAARARDHLAGPADDVLVSNADVLSHELAGAEAQLGARQRYVQVSMQAARSAAAALALFLISNQLGFDITGSGSAAAQAWLLSTSVSVLITVAVSYLLWRLFTSYIGPYMPAARQVVFDDENGTTPGTRLETLVPLLRNIVRVVLIVFAAMIALSNIGVVVGPLIAGASVIGIAIGFGAQRLVQDVVSGIFFLIDDAFRLGEYIEFDELREQFILRRVAYQMIKDAFAGHGIAFAPRQVSVVAGGRSELGASAVERTLSA